MSAHARELAVPEDGDHEERDSRDEDHDRDDDGLPKGVEEKVADCDWPGVDWGDSVLFSFSCCFSSSSALGVCSLSISSFKDYEDDRDEDRFDGDGDPDSGALSLILIPVHCGSVSVTPFDVSAVVEILVVT